MRQTFRYRIKSGNAGHPRAAGQWNNVQEHILVVERAIGKHLQRTAEVHHVNGDGRDNRNTNLVVCQDRAYHKLLHCRAEVVKAGSNPNTHKLCGRCGPRPFADFNNSRDNKTYGLYSLCRECQRESFAAWSQKRRVNYGIVTPDAERVETR